MRIRGVRKEDQGFVLGYCRDTFDWGDYIGNVWNDWQSDGEFLVCEGSAPAASSPPRPVGICHVHMSPGQAWIEGIRVHPQHRRRGIATRLVREAEQMTLRQQRPPPPPPPPPPTTTTTYDGLASAMIIDTKNESSLAMARRLEYEITSTWTYHKVSPRRPDAGARCRITELRDLDRAAYPHFVSEWRWFETRRLGADGVSSEGPSATTDTARFVRSDGPTLEEGGGRATVSVLAAGKYLGGSGRTLYATLYPGTDPAGIDEVITFLAGAAASESYVSVSIFTLGGLPPGCREWTPNPFEFYLTRKRLA